MHQLLKACGIELTELQLELMWGYHQLLRRHDDELNLTRIRNFENMVLKLYADSILPAIQYPALPSPLLDLGSGPGMPGIPLAIFRPDLSIHLSDTRRQRTDFLQTVVDELALTNVTVIHRGIAPDFSQPMAGVITRAVESIGDTLVRVSGCIQPNGLVIFMKGPHCDEEIDTATGHFAGAFALTDNIAYDIPHTSHHRRLVVYRRGDQPVPSFGKLTGSSPHRIKVIESESNPVYKELKKLHTGRGIKKQGRTLVCGQRLTAEALTQMPGQCRAWISRGERQAPPREAPEMMEWFQLGGDLFRTLDTFNSRAPILLADCPPLPVWQPDEAPATGCNLLVPFQDPDNVGAVIRSAAAMGVARIILLAESANPFHPKAVRASAGTVFSAPLFQGPALADLPADLPVIALAGGGRPIARVAFPDAFYLLTGMEGPGLPPQWQSNAVAIPMAEGVESLNATVATSIALYEWQRSVG